MNTNALTGLVAGALLAIATLATATPGNALACPGGLGETCGRTVSEPAPVQLAAGGCGAAASRAAAAQGGQVIGAPRKVERGGRTMCVVTVLIRDPSGKKPPTRRQVTVPAD